MKKDSLLNILIIICSIMIIIGIVVIFTKKEKNPNEEIISSPTASPIISPTDNPTEPKYERITFSVGMEIYFDPEKNSVCDNYTEENSYRGINSGCMRFYGLSNEYGYVNMLLDHDFNKNSYNWASRQDYPNEDTIKKVGISNYGNQNYGTFGNNNRGPVTVLRLMLEYTKDWQTSVPDIYNYSNGFNIDYSGHKARILSLNDTKPICTEKANNGQYNKCPEWMYKQLGKHEGNLYWGYWMVDPSKNSDERAFRITDVGLVKDLYVDNDVCGIRPVLVVPEDKILNKLIEN